MVRFGLACVVAVFSIACARPAATAPGSKFTAAPGAPQTAAPAVATSFECPTTDSGPTQFLDAGSREVHYRVVEPTDRHCPPGLSGCVAMSTAGAPCPRFEEAWVWTGERIVVYGGRAHDGTVLGNGATFDPFANRWNPLPREGAPPPQQEPLVLGLPKGFVVWGAEGGAAYHFETERWEAIPDRGAPEQVEQGAVVAGRLMVFPGRSHEKLTEPGWIYDFATQRWARQRPFPRTQRVLFAVGLTDEAVFVWGGAEFSNWDATFGDGAMYFPASNRWRALPERGAPSARYGARVRLGERGTLFVTGGKVNTKDDAPPGRAFAGTSWSALPRPIPDDWLDHRDGRRRYYRLPDYVLGPARGAVQTSSRYIDPAKRIPEAHQLDATQSDRDMLGFLGGDLLIGDPELVKVYRIHDGRWQALSHPIVEEGGRSYRLAWIGDRLVAWGGHRVLSRRNEGRSTGGDAELAVTVEQRAIYSDGFVWTPG